MPLEKNEETTLTVENLGINGEGIARESGEAVFIDGVLPGETVRARVIFARKNYCVGKVLELLPPPSPIRAVPPCPVFGKCGGCGLQHMTYPAQLTHKTQIVADTLRKIGKIDTPVLPCVASLLQYNYRNKCSLPCANIGGKAVFGLFAAASHRVVPIKSCPISGEFTEKIIRAMEKYMHAANISAYDETQKTGLVRHVVARELDGTLLVTVVVSSGTRLPRQNDCIAALKEEFGEKFSLFINTNAADTNVICSEHFTHAHGAAENFATIGGVRVRVSPASFLQVNDAVRDLIYSAVCDEISAGDYVLDAYSGAGILSAQIAKRGAKRVVGIEIVPEAVADARLAAVQNGVEDILQTVSGDCGKIFAQALAGVVTDCRTCAGESTGVTVILDPPRKGCQESVLAALNSCSFVKKILYISCNPATLARDLAILSGAYRVEFIKPYDMFPQTPHVETLVRLTPAVPKLTAN